VKAKFKDLSDFRAVVLLKGTENRKIERLEHVGGVGRKKKEVYVMLEGGKHKAVSRVTTVAVKNQEACLFRGFRGWDGRKTSVNQAYAVLSLV